MKNTALQKAIEICGSQGVLAERIETTQATVSRWAKSRVSAEYVIAIESATAGQVTRHQLRPDLYPQE